jgi:hypothetical protein
LEEVDDLEVEDEEVALDLVVDKGVDVEEAVGFDEDVVSVEVLDVVNVVDVVDFDVEVEVDKDDEVFSLDGVDEGGVCNVFEGAAVVVLLD